MWYLLDPHLIADLLIRHGGLPERSGSGDARRFHAHLGDAGEKFFEVELIGFGVPVIAWLPWLPPGRLPARLGPNTTIKFSTSRSCDAG